MAYVVHMSPDQTVVTVTRHGHGAYARIEVRGAPGYGQVFNPGDPIQAFMDAMDPASVSGVMTFEPFTVNPRNPRSAPSIEACEKIFTDTP